MSEITWGTVTDYAARGYLSVSRHDTLPLSVVCYTRAAQFERMWDDVTKTARGLVLHDDGRVVGRGLPKFFALDDPLFVTPPIYTPHTTYDKADGSLIHVTEYEGELLVWTKGSFNSDHALEARKYLDGWKPNTGTTALFEGIFGSLNRVVVDYEGFEGLILLGEIEHETGIDWINPVDVAVETGWGGEVVTERPELSVAQVKDFTSNENNGKNREGFVVVYPQTGGPAVRGKAKFVTYLRLHRIMTGLTPRRIHEQVVAAVERSGLDWRRDWHWIEFIESLPDEMDSAVQGVIDEIWRQSDEEFVAAGIASALVKKNPSLERREIAERFSILPPNERSLAFLIYDGFMDRARLLSLKRVEVGTDKLMVLDDDA